MFGAACSWVVSKSMCWRRVGRVGAGHAGLGALAAEPRLHPDPAAGRAEPERHPVERRVAADLGALGAEDPGALGERLPAHVAEVGVVGDDQLGDGVEHALDLLGGRQVLLPDLGLGALLEHDQRALVDERPGPRLDGGQRDRRLEHHPAGHVHEAAAADAGVVERDEHVVDRPRSANRVCSASSIVVTITPSGSSGRVGAATAAPRPGRASGATRS